MREVSVRSTYIALILFFVSLFVRPSAAPAADSFQYDILKELDPTTGINPVGNLIFAGGKLYGIAQSFDNISTTNETIFSLSADGSNFQVLHEFATQVGDGRQPERNPLLASDDRLYGVTYYGGANDRGSIYGINTDGTGYQILYSFAGVTVSDGQNPENGLSEGDDGYLYGTTFIGGLTKGGTVFRVNKAGTVYSIVLNMTSTSNGLNSPASVMRGGDGWLYGVAQFGGNLGGGGIFKLQTNGTGYEAIHFFQNNSADGYRPQGRLMEASDGLLYGITYYGGNGGTIFRLSKDGSQFEVIRKFGAGEGSTPNAPLSEGADGRIYGALAYSGALSGIFSLDKDGSNYGMIHYFDGGIPMGLLPFGGVTFGRPGKMFGCTSIGGIELDEYRSYGLIFRLVLQPQVAVTQPSPEDLSLQIHGAVGETYRLEQSPVLPAVQWNQIQDVTTDTQGDSPPIQTTATTSGNQFFRAIRSQ